MAHTVAALYDNYTEAQEAMSELLRSGFSFEQVSLNPNEDSSEARSAALRAPQHQDEGGLAGTIGGFFRSLFGSPEQDLHADIYSEAIRRGSYLLTVHTESDAQSDSVTAIMNRYQPVDIDERAEQWQSQGWSRYDATAPALTDAEIQQERERSASARMQAGASGEKTGIPLIQDELKLGKDDVQRGGARAFQRMDENVAAGNEDFRHANERTNAEAERMGGGAQAAADTAGTLFDDSDFRSHWQSTYGASSGARYEDYAPAYQYGSRMAGEERFRSYRWSDVEPDVRQQWESDNAGHPWERVKGAIRYGWDKVTGQG